MDASEVSVRPLRPTLLILVAAGVCLISGCGGRAPNAARKTAKREKVFDPKKFREGGTTEVTAINNQFEVKDLMGKPLIMSKVFRVTAAMGSAKGMQGPVKMEKTRSRLFQKGQAQMDLDSPEAQWDGKLLISDRPVHGVMADKSTVMDGNKAKWTAATGHLWLADAKVQAIREGKIDFTAEGPQAHVEKQIVTMDSGAVARKPDGQTLTAQHVRWNLKTGELEANGNVVVSRPGTRITAERLKGNTQLNKGRVSGRVRVQLDKAPDSRDTGSGRSRNPRKGAKK